MHGKGYHKQLKNIIEHITAKHLPEQEITEIFYYSIIEDITNQLFSVVRKANPLNRFNRPKGLLNYEFSVFSVLSVVYKIRVVLAPLRSASASRLLCDIKKTSVESFKSPEGLVGFYLWLSVCICGQFVGRRTKVKGLRSKAVITERKKAAQEGRRRGGREVGIRLPGDAHLVPDRVS